MSEPPRARHTRRDDGDRVSVPASAPEPADARVESRLFEARIAMERRASRMSDDDARALRSRFDDALVRLAANVRRAADHGEISETEARAVCAATLRYRSRTGDT